MHTTVTTTITTRIDLDTFEPDHSVSIEAEDALPEQVIYAAVIGACRATLNSVPGGTATESDSDEAPCGFDMGEGDTCLLPGGHSGKHS